MYDRTASTSGSVSVFFESRHLPKSELAVFDPVFELSVRVVPRMAILVMGRRSGTPIPCISPWHTWQLVAYKSAPLAAFSFGLLAGSARIVGTD